MAGYCLSFQARQSLVRIGEYTLENHGRQQRTKYLKMLRDHMRRVAKYPEHGQKRDDIKEGYYSVLAQKHSIYYRVQASQVEIIDVLHQSMEPAQRL